MVNLGCRLEPSWAGAIPILIVSLHLDLKYFSTGPRAAASPEICATIETVSFDCGSKNDAS